MAYVMMAIPAELVPAVSAFLEAQEPAYQMAQAAKNNEHEGREPGFVHGWDRSTVQRAYRESADRLRDLLDFLASNPNREVSAPELADAIEAKYGWNTVAGMLGAFGRRSVNRYGRPEPMWEYRYDPQGRILITMPEGPAKAVREAARGK
ncbi:MAG: hypothetical protein ACJ76B_08265 [Solirubrobacterales bacterium]